MKSTFLILFLVFPALLFGQSLAEVAKKEKERREQNKKEGKEVHVLSEEDIERVRPPSSETEEGSGEEGTSGAPAASSGAGGSEDSYGDGDEEGDVPTFIPPDRPLPEKLALFERMKRHYDSQAKEIDSSIAENEARIRKLQTDLAATSAAGGAGLPVPPSVSTDATSRQLTGQESATITEEINRLQAMNDQLRTQKDRLKLDVQEKGRAAGIPPGYLRF